MMGRSGRPAAARQSYSMTAVALALGLVLVASM